MNCRTSIGLFLFWGLSGTSFGSEVGDPFNPMGIKFTDGSQWQYDSSSGFRFGDSDQLELGETDIDQMQQHFSRLKQIFGSNPLLDDPNMRIIELKANKTWLSPLVNLDPEERRNKLEEKRVALCQKYEKRKQLAANPEMKKNMDAQRQQHINWLKTLFELSIERLEIIRNEIQVQLHRARNSGDQNSTASLDFRLRELNTLIEINPNMSKKAFEVLCQWKQTIEELPLEKLEEGLRRNLDAVENMLKANEESPKEFTQWLQETIRDIEATIHYLQTTTQPTALSSLGFDL